MIKNNSSARIYDVFKSSIEIKTNGCTPFCNEVLLIYRINKNNSIEMCQNIMNIGKEFHEQLSVVWSGKRTAQSSPATYGTRFYGDINCNKNNNGICLKDINMNDIYNQCQYCADAESFCDFYFIFNIKKSL